MPVHAQTSESDRNRALLHAAELIQNRYVDANAGRQIAKQLRRDVSARRFKVADSDEAFAALVTQRLRKISGDGHFAFSPRPTADSELEDEDVLLERWYGTGVNHGFASVQRLEGGIGYLDLRVFAPVEMGGDLAVAAMSLLAQSPALIVDLRKNGGGMGEMVTLLAAYLFDSQQEMSGTFNRPSGVTTRLFTPLQVKGRRFGANKPVFILVSNRTFSAAEHFAYDLQAMKRAVIIGERTGGGAHPSEDQSLGDVFFLTLPESRSISPITGTNWEGTGVTPDVVTLPQEALATALALAQTAIHQTAAP